jgi:hypothetical protein
MNHHNYSTTAVAPACSEESEIVEKLKQVEVLKLLGCHHEEGKANIDTKLLMPEPILLQYLSQRRDYHGIIAMYTLKLRVLEPAFRV